MEISPKNPEKMARVDVNDLDHPGLAAAVTREMRTMSVDDVVAKSGGEFSNTWLRSVLDAKPSVRLKKKLVALSLALHQPEDWAYSILHREGQPPAAGDLEAWISRLETLVASRPPDAGLVASMSPEEKQRVARTMGELQVGVAEVLEALAEPEAAAAPLRRGGRKPRPRRS